MDLRLEEDYIQDVDHVLGTRGTSAAHVRWHSR
jgi:hypothetical protein